MVAIMSSSAGSEAESDCWTTSYADSDLTFFMIVFRNFDLAEASLKELRDHFPGAHVVVRSDGDPDPRYHQLSRRYKVDYRAEDRLFSARHGGAVVQRMLEIFLQQPTTYLFKIDPDTEIHRRFSYLPAESAMFGTVQGASDYLSIQGGCIGFTREAAERISDSGLLLDPILRNCREDSPPHLARLSRRMRERGLASFDWSLGWAADQIGVRLVDFPEVYSTYGEVVSLPGGEKDMYAVTHPKVVSDASREDYLRLQELGLLSQKVRRAYVSGEHDG